MRMAGRGPAKGDGFDCGVSGGAGSMAGATSYGGSGGGGQGGGDETNALPALPSPCKGDSPPLMAILDVTIIRTEDNIASNYGINLLDGLSYVFNRSTQIADTLTQVGSSDASRNITITRQRSHGLPGAGIAYSLNIANAMGSRSEVLARPSLVALDRKASTFFSGRNLTIGIPGQAGGASMIADKPIGVSLSATPTFIDDETLLVAVRAARSFIEQVDNSVSFGHSIQTSRNAVTANVVLKFGQTLILSGLAEQEVQSASSGVPVLQEIPALQYLFRSKEEQRFSRSVLILITPRRPETDDVHAARALAAIRPGQSAKTQPNLHAAYQGHHKNRLYLQFRNGDIQSDEWRHPSRLTELFRQLGTILYY